MKDIAPELLEAIESEFADSVLQSKTIQRLQKLIDTGTATYAEANDYAIEVGEILATAFKNHLSSDVLPNGRMYYNIAERILSPTLGHNHELISDTVMKIQADLNKAAGLGIMSIQPPLNQDRIKGIIDRVSSEEHFDDIAWILQEPVVNFSQSIVDDSIKVNADFHSRSGLSPKIIRKSTGKCCDWCNAVVGTYSYPDVPKDVYRRHRFCKCTVDYDPGDGKRRNVHTKKISGSKEHLIAQEQIMEKQRQRLAVEKEGRKVIGLKVNNTQIRGLSEHTYDRMESRKISADHILDAIKNPIDSTPIKYDALGRPSYEVIGRKVTIAINPDTGIITTTWPTKTKLANKLIGQGKGEK